MHSSYFLLTTKKVNSIFKIHEILAQLIAALCHDIGHTGHTNTFEINSSSIYAITHNDKSVLENHHAALTFQLLQNESCNIFENLPHNVYRAVRKLIIKCILGTDMIKHFNMISTMSARFKDIEERPLGSLDDDCEKAASFLIHVADLGHNAKEFDLYSEWSNLVCRELSNQYRDEITNELPPTEHLKGIDDPKIYYANEIGFLTVVVKPMWECLGL